MSDSRSLSLPRGSALVLAGLAMPAALAGPPADPPAMTRLVTAGGLPAAGARVEAFALSAAPGPFAGLTSRLFSGETDADGRLPNAIPAVDALLVVDLAGHAPFVGRFVGGGLPGELALRAGRSLAGRVTAEEGAPLPGARVCARWTERLAEVRRETTWERCAEAGESGRFVIAGLGEARVTLGAEAPGFLSAKASWAPGGPEATLALRPGTLVAGLVRDRAGRPVAGAEVRGPSTVAQVDGDGRFELAVAALPVDLAATAAGHRPSRLRVAASGKPVALVLDPGQQVALAVLGDGREPLAGAALWVDRLIAPGRKAGERIDLALDADGATVADLPEPGRYRLRLEVPGYRGEELGEVELAAGERIDLGAFAPSRGAGLSGRTVDERSGEPLAGVEVRLLPQGASGLEALRRGAGWPRAVSAQDGRFALGGLEPGSYELRLARSGRAPGLREVALEPDRTLDLGDLGLARGVAVSGRVVRGDGRPRPAVAVRFFGPSGEALEPLAEATTGADGGFGELTLAPGTYQVRVAGRRRLLAQGVDVPEGEPEHRLELVAPGVDVAGRVERGGEPVAGGSLTLAAAHDPGRQRGVVIVHTAGDLAAGDAQLGGPDAELFAAVGEDGRFAIEDVPPGLLTATYFDPAGPVAERRLAIADRPLAEVVLDLGGGEISGRVVAEGSGEPVSARLRVLDAESRSVAEGSADASGSFHFAGLPDGDLRLEASATGYRTAVVAAARDGAEPQVVELAPAGAGRLAIRLRHAAGAPAAAVPVTVLADDGRMVRSLLTDSAGVRVYDELEPGTYFVVWADGVAGVGASGPLAVEAGAEARFEASLAPGAPVALRCTRGGCADRPVQALAVFAASGVDVGPQLAAFSGVARFSVEGRLPLGRLSPGSYRVRVWVDGSRIEGPLTVAGDEILLSLP